MGRRDAGFVSITPVDPEIGTPLWEAARDAYSRSAGLWTCMVVVATYHGAPVKIRSGATTVTRVSLDDLLNSIEALGWTLEHVDHVYVQTTTSSGGGIGVAGVSGQLEAHLVFRRRP